MRQSSCLFGSGVKQVMNEGKKGSKKKRKEVMSQIWDQQI